MVWLESMHVLWSSRISCVWTLIRSRQGHPRKTPSRPPPHNPTSQHQIIMQEQLKSWKAAGLEQFWGCTIWRCICLPKGCKMVPEWPKAHTPRPHLTFFTQPDFLWHMYILCMVGAGNRASKWAGMLIASGRECQLAMFGGVQWWGRPYVVLLYSI